MRVRTLSSDVVCSLTSLPLGDRAPPLAGEHRRRRRAAARPARASATAPATPAHPAPVGAPRLPITARTPNVAYSGPVYEKTATGEVVPYARARATRPGEASTTPAAAPSAIDRRRQSPSCSSRARLARYVNGLAAAPMSRAGGRAGDHLGRQPDHRPALHLRRRPRLVHLARAMTARAPSPSRCTAPSLLADARGLLGIRSRGARTASGAG